MSFKSTNQYKLNLNTMNLIPCCFMLHSKLQNESKHTKNIIKVAKTTGTVIQVLQYICLINGPNKESNQIKINIYLYSTVEVQDQGKEDEEVRGDEPNKRGSLLPGTITKSKLTTALWLLPAACSLSLQRPAR